MVYLEYEECKQKYLDAQEIFSEILQTKEELFAQTQPLAVSYDSEHVDGGNPANRFDSYLITKDRLQLDAKLEEAKALMEERLHLMHLKEQELRSSKDVHDRIYVMRYLDHIRVFIISRRVRYSESQVYRILEKIEKRAKLARKCEKSMLL